MEEEAVKVIVDWSRNKGYRDLLENKYGVYKRSRLRRRY
jgi:hypothetical protein